jgi:hypothetical protein
MSGILDKKQRLVDFILTANGYKQIENGDLRFVYASLTDSEAIYDYKQNEYNVADLEVMPFFLEASSNFFDQINTEIDLKQTANFELRTEIDGQYIDLRNNEYKNAQTLNNISDSQIFDKVATGLVENLRNQKLILTDSFYNLNVATGSNDKISLFVNKINNESFDITSRINNSDELLSVRLKSVNDYFTLTNSNSLNLSKVSMIEDDRFKNKINYLFLPPSNMNRDVITKNNKIMNSYNLAQDDRDSHKIIFKNFKSNNDVDVELIKTFMNFSGSDDEIILESIKLLENDKFEIAKMELKFENQEYDSEFILNLSEFNNQNSGVVFNKLLFINHGEIFDKTKQKNVQVYSAGKLFSSKTEIDFDNNFNNNLDNGNYIIEDNYLFVNLFTIVIE